MEKKLKILLIFVIFSFNGVYAKESDNLKTLEYEKNDSLYKYLENFIRKYRRYDCDKFPILIVDSDTAKIDGENFLNVKFYSYSAFVDLAVLNRSDIFLHYGNIHGRKVVFRINAGRDLFIEPLKEYLQSIKSEDKKYYRLLIKMVNTRINDLGSGTCLGIETEEYSPEMNLIFDGNNNVVKTIYYDESNNPLLINLRKLGIKYELNI